jgi:hypothetical protein
VADPKVSVRHDEERELYELGATIDGVFVPFFTVPESDVTAAVEQAPAQEPQAA